MCSHVQSCKLVPEAGVRCHVRASSAGGCAACPPFPAAHGPLALPPPPPLPPPVIILACLLSGSPCMLAVVLYYCTVPQGTVLLRFWCWRRLLRIPWTERSIQSILKEINSEYLLEGDAKAEALIVWVPDAIRQLIGKDPGAGKD